MEIEIRDGLSIPEGEVWFTASRSGGPGGQNVNKVNSRVTLWFDVAASPSLSPEQKRRILTRLATRVSGEGVLRVVSQNHRSQAANREAAVDRLARLLREALEPVKFRRETRVPLAAKRLRLEEKKRRARIKRDRSSRPARDD